MSTRQAWGRGPPCGLDSHPGLAAAFLAALGGDGAVGLIKPRKHQKSSTSRVLELTGPWDKPPTPSLLEPRLRLRVCWLESRTATW